MTNDITQGEKYEIARQLYNNANKLTVDGTAYELVKTETLKTIYDCICFRILDHQNDMNQKERRELIDASHAIYIPNE